MLEKVTKLFKKRESTLPAEAEATPSRRRAFFLVSAMGLALALALSLLASVAFADKAGAAGKSRSFDVTDTVSQSGLQGPANGIPLADNPYTYSGTSKFVRLNQLTITLTLSDGDTGVNDFDRGDLTLALDGIDTGIELNGFRGGQTDTRTITGVPNHAAQILTRLKQDGDLFPTIIDHSPGDLNIVGVPDNRNTTLELFGKKNQKKRHHRR